MKEPTVASWFSGVGGLDMGLERAGLRVVSHSEIDPYASAVLAERWPGIVNLGDIVALAGSLQRNDERDGADASREPAGRLQPRDGVWTGAFLWTGGFPCQDLSVAGKRRGMVEGTRSNLAYAFLALVERHRPPAILLENVPGLLSSHGGRDMAALLGAMVELGYGVAYRILDARHFGVPQRRRRLFIVGLRSDPDDVEGRAAAERAAAVLAVGARCRRHPATGHEAGESAPDGARTGLDVAGNLTRRYGKGINSTVDDGAVVIGAVTRRPYDDRGHEQGGLVGSVAPGGRGWRGMRGDGADPVVVGPSPDSGGVREADGLAGRLDDLDDLAGPLLAGGNGGQRTTDLNTPLAFVKQGRAQTADDGETWGEGEVMPTLNSFDVGDVRTTAAIVGTPEADDPMLPLGLDSHRYRCCGNGVVADVGEWVGHRLYPGLIS